MPKHVRVPNHVNVPTHVRVPKHVNVPNDVNVPNHSNVPKIVNVPNHVNVPTDGVKTARFRCRVSVSAKTARAATPRRAGRRTPETAKTDRAQGQNHASLAGIVRHRSPVPTVPAARTGAEMAKSAVRKAKITLSGPAGKKKKQCPSPVPITPRGPGARYGPRV